ncbi:hypothetical protein ACG33_04800 [Steroidobacter denitrificans]|uniref:Glycosyl transferase family 1 domain-containing protein n=2 Tax=Steroidobacter denitrificans TaxID=465721 RepID=A0A127F7K7_STEDE|nr:hypothetical protein ACG33_04800 [Steroidobacter denitrificans]
MWPDIYVEAVPSFIRPVARRLLRSDFDMTREAFRRASAITAHAPGFVEWGLDYADRSRRTMDRDFPFAYPIHPPTAEEVAGAERFWIEKGLTGVANEFVICFFGTFTERKELDVETVLRTARELRQQLPQVKFVLCGTGPAEARYIALAAELGNVLFPGWVDYPQIWTLMRRAKVGILPYLPSADFIASMPNKSIEYLSAGLPVLTCLRGGYLQTVLEEGGCGIFYHGETPGSLKEAIQHLVSDRGGLQTRRSAAARLFEQRFREDRVYSQMVDHLELMQSSDA